MANGELQGWSDDPFNLHEARYFSAGRPTKLVRDGSVETYDEPPSEPPLAAAATAGNVLCAPATPVRVPAELSEDATLSQPSRYSGPRNRPGSYEQTGGDWSVAPHQQVARHRLGGLGVAAAIFLGISALGGVAAIVFPRVSALAVLALPPTAIVCLIWFVRARANAEQTDWPQPLSRSWAFWGWVVPVIFLWFPCKIMAGIWRASQPMQDRGRPLVLVAAWWTCWLLAWLTGFREVTRTATGIVTRIFGFWFEGTTVSKSFAVLAAVLFAVIIARVSSGRLGTSSAATPVMMRQEADGVGG